MALLGQFRLQRLDQFSSSSSRRCSFFYRFELQLFLAQGGIGFSQFPFVLLPDIAGTRHIFNKR